MFSAASIKLPSTAQLLPLLTKLGGYLKDGLDHYAALKMAGKEAGPDIVAAFVFMKMEDWHPEISGKKILDIDTKMAAARFLAGIAVNFVG